MRRSFYSSALWLFQSRFARTGWSHNSHEFAVLDIKSYSAQSLEFNFAGPVNFSNTLNFDHGLSPPASKGPRRRPAA